MGGTGVVDFYIDCWEGSYRKLLTPSVLGKRYAANCYPFARRVLTINNVNDRREVWQLADAAIARGECDEYVIVADELPMALDRCGLRQKDIEPIAHFVDFLLVTVATARAEFVLHMAGDVYLAQDFDWVSDAVAALRRNRQYLIANPHWLMPGETPPEAQRFENPHWVSYGCSDQCFLGSTARLAAPIYGDWHYLTYIYPMAVLGFIFEARIYAHMRNHRLLRLTDSRVSYVHETDPAAPSGTHTRGTKLQQTLDTLARRLANARLRRLQAGYQVATRDQRA